MFRTVTTVTGDMAVTAILGRGEVAARRGAGVPGRRRTA
jgi:hypothetical protein